MFDTKVIVCLPQFIGVNTFSKAQVSDDTYGKFIEIMYVFVVK